MAGCRRSHSPPPPRRRGGEQVDVRTIRAADVDTLHERRALGRGQVAGYLAKYATKHTEALGPLDRRLRAADLAVLAVNPHVHRLVLTAWLLAARYPRLEGQRDLRLDAWAHPLGYGGHFLTKSRHYSTTFTNLRKARADWQHRHHHTLLARMDPWERLAATARNQFRTSWQMAGIGWRLPADALLARGARANAAAAREAARDERAARQRDEALAA